MATVPDPTPVEGSVVVRVEATGVCRSDWHGWLGHDEDITLPHVPGHELAGTIVAVGKGVQNWRVDDRVTVPFVGGCGACPQCHAGHQQVCDDQFQPGFTHWGSFAEYVALHRADLNVVRLPQTIDFATAASLGCRFITSFRAIIDQGCVSPGEWVAVHGCGGVGLSAIMIATAVGANVVAIDITPEKLALAEQFGAAVTINAADADDVPDAVKAATAGGAHVSMDALGHTQTCVNSILSLRKRGKHIQVGLMAGEHRAPAIPMGAILANELEIIGSHGMQAHRYDAVMAMIKAGLFRPERLVGRQIALEDAIDVLINMDKFQDVGTTVITDFR